MEQKTRGTMSMATAKRITESSITSKPERLAPKGRPKALTNRDYFAGLFAGVLFDKNHSTMNLREIQKEAYRMADFMIAEEVEEE
jgi:hypothetical protein|tara:strand:+ start:616 stop:870 length:255 start_codon:yes stop_codon:yes gene_type:complete